MNLAAAKEEESTKKTKFCLVMVSLVMVSLFQDVGCWFCSRLGILALEMNPEADVQMPDPLSRFRSSRNRLLADVFDS